MGVEAQHYHGWWVFAVPQDGHWTPECYRSAGREVCRGVVVYESPLEAIDAAKSFVDRVLMRAALLYVLDEWLEVDKINDQEYEKLVQSIYSNVRGQ